MRLNFLSVDGIRKHRDSTGQDLCWHHPALWSLLLEKTDPLPVVPAWAQFLAGCMQYRQSLDDQAPQAPRSDEPYEVGQPGGLAVLLAALRHAAEAQVPS